ncbi:MAG: aspartate-semialdehyde dehydrogenase, partial [Acidimicrobiales bacterium]
MALTVGIYGATGQVGGVMRDVLVARGFPFTRLRLFASARSAGRSLGGVRVEDVATADHGGVDLALFSMGGAASRQFGERVARAGTIVVDNSAAWRMDPGVPLVVSEVNPAALDGMARGIVANPNCTTMVAMPALKALHDEAGLVAVVAATYQATSGAGRAGVAELRSQVAAVGDRAGDLVYDGGALEWPPASVFPGPVAFNVIPQAGAFDGDDTVEELKFANESRKILDLAGLAVSVTCVRVPVYTGHSIALHATFERPISPERAIEVLRGAPGV